MEAQFTFFGDLFPELQGEVVLGLDRVARALLPFVSRALWARFKGGATRLRTERLLLAAAATGDWPFVERLATVFDYYLPSLSEKLVWPPGMEVGQLEAYHAQYLPVMITWTGGGTRSYTIDRWRQLLVPIAARVPHHRLMDRLITALCLYSFMHSSHATQLERLALEVAIGANNGAYVDSYAPAEILRILHESIIDAHMLELAVRSGSLQMVDRVLHLLDPLSTTDPQATLREMVRQLGPISINAAHVPVTRAFITKVYNEYDIGIRFDTVLYNALYHNQVDMVRYLLDELRVQFRAGISTLMALFRTEAHAAAFDLLLDHSSYQAPTETPFFYHDTYPLAGIAYFIRRRLVHAGNFTLPPTGTPALIRAVLGDAALLAPEPFDRVLNGALYEDDPEALGDLLRAVKPTEAHRQITREVMCSRSPAVSGALLSVLMRHDFVAPMDVFYLVGAEGHWRSMLSTVRCVLDHMPRPLDHAQVNEVCGIILVPRQSAVLLDPAAEHDYKAILKTLAAAGFSIPSHE